MKYGVCLFLFALGLPRAKQIDHMGGKKKKTWKAKGPVNLALGLWCRKTWSSRHKALPSRLIGGLTIEKTCMAL